MVTAFVRDAKLASIGLLAVGLWATPTLADATLTPVSSTRTVGASAPGNAPEAYWDGSTPVFGCEVTAHNGEGQADGFGRAAQDSRYNDFGLTGAYQAGASDSGAGASSATAEFVANGDFDHTYTFMYIGGGARGGATYQIYVDVRCGDAVLYSFAIADAGTQYPVNKTFTIHFVAGQHYTFNQRIVGSSVAGGGFSGLLRF